ncbi:hypothetical protein ACFL08_00430 [Patescibacteria group bacterium]
MHPKHTHQKYPHQSLFEILESLTVNISSDDLEKAIKERKAIILPIDFELVSYITEINTIKEKKFFLKIDICDSTEKKLNETKNTIGLQKNLKRLRTRVRFNNLPITEEGIYIFKVSTKNKEKDSYKTVAKIPLEIVITKNI